MTTRFWFVRHGPTHTKAAIGWTDLPADLSDRRTVDALKSALPDTGVVVSSDLIRAIATADALLGSQTRLDHDADLREIHFGDWEGHSFDAISAREREERRIQSCHTPAPILAQQPSLHTEEAAAAFAPNSTSKPAAASSSFTLENGRAVIGSGRVT